MSAERGTPQKPTMMVPADSTDSPAIVSDPPAAPSGHPSIDGFQKTGGGGRFFKRPPAWVRWGIPAAVILIAGIVQSVLWYRNAGDATGQVMSSWILFPTTTFLLVLWWLFLSGFAWKTRLAGLAAGGALVAAFFAIFRVKEFTGEMIPRFESRWQRSSEDRAADYWKQADNDVVIEATALPKSTASAPAATASLVPTRGDWPQFEGPNRDGIAPGVRVRTDWSRHPPRMVWRHPVGAGWSSFALVGPYAFTQEQRGQDEAAVCYEADTGKQVWAHVDKERRFTSELGGIGPRATPTVAASRVYTFGASGILNCLDAQTGNVLWSTNAVREAGASVLNFGMAGSPLVYDNLVVVNAGGTRTSMAGKEHSGRALAAYDRLTGNLVWAAGDYQAGYASPILATIGGVRQIVIFDGLGAAGHDAASGKELWRSPEWTNVSHNNCAQPIVQADGSVFLSSGYGTGCVLLDVKQSGSEWTASPRWQAPNRFKLKFNTGVSRAGCVYGLDEGILSCFDLSTGKVRWKKGRYGYGQVLLLDQGLLVVSEAGDVILVDVSPSQGSEIARFHAIDGQTWNYPAIKNGRLFVRNAEEAACYDVGGAGESPQGSVKND